MYDVIVVGARCAGSPTAMLLARAGHRVLLVDRSTFPSDTVSTHYIHPPAIARAQRWGILDRITATGCPPIHEIHWGVEGVWFTGSVPHTDGLPAYAPRRSVLDKVLLDAAADAGAEVREGCTVRDLVWDAGRVVGIRGDEGIEQARYVVGADGKRSVVARAVAAEEYDAEPTHAFWTYAYYSGIPAQQQYLYMGDGWGGSLGPTHDGLHLVMAGGRRERMPDFSRDLVGNSMKVWERIAPRVAELVRGGTRETRIVGMGDLPGYFRRASGPGWALVGDAGHHKDPVTAGGIGDAWRQAALLADALRAILERGAAEDEALGGYERARDEGDAGFYRLTCRAAALETVPAERLGVFDALASNRPQADAYSAVMAGVLPADRFWARQNVARILAGAPPADWAVG